MLASLANTRLDCLAWLQGFTGFGMQDPKQRITMAKVMRHPWVTKRGQWPLKSVREMLRDDGKIDDDEPELPDLMSTFNVLDVPRQVPF